MLSNGAISWNSKRQPTVAASTTEAEYMAAAAAVKEALWLRKLCESLDIPITTMKIMCDNQSAIKLLRNPIFSVRSKHIDVAHHFARERVQSKEVEFSYVPTTEMVADVLTNVELRFCLRASTRHAVLKWEWSNVVTCSIAVQQYSSDRH
jgi:hypothetical protein